MPRGSVPMQARTLHPIAALLLAGCLPLFLGTWLADWAYVRNYEVQWINFAAWLNAGALVIVGFALLASGLDALLRRRRSWIVFALVAVTFVLGFIDALVHARDAYATMPHGLILSFVVFLLAAVALVAGLVRTSGDAR